MLSLLCLAASGARAQAPPCTANTLNHLGTGCEQLDLLFNNLALIGGNGPNASLILTTFPGASETTGLTESFATAWVASDLGSPAATHATIGFDVSVDLDIPAAPGKSWAISSLSLAQAGAAVIGPGASVDIKENFCLGASTFNCTPTSGNYGYIDFDLVRVAVGVTSTTDTVCFNNGGSSCTPASGSLTFTLPIPQEQVAIQDVLTLSAPGILRTANLNDVSNTFVQTPVPEPATWWMAALSLAGFAAAARRRRLNARR